ncbi:Bax inhibitor-1/YccA family protein [Thermopolyspora sp. NPDC052614]|uniref:Bax inhibitor-1/YccA family protein n=1 Tax=Thermopolyspora sp. NPDC052614 TaxID=3155682 RepID=UPI003416C8BB
MQSRNPVFSRQRANQGAWNAPPPSPDQLQHMYSAPSYAPPAVRPMTIDDVVVRGFITLGTLVVSAAAAWALDFPIAFALVGVIAGLVLALIISFRQSTNPALILGYSVAYGVAVGIISHVYNEVYNGIVFQAVVGTALAFGAMLAVHSLRIIRVTPRFTRFLVGAVIALMGLMIVNWLASFFIQDGIGIRSGGALSIVFSVVAILVGCFFLLLDFHDIEQGVRAGVPERYSWLMAFGLTVTLVWIYLEILRFISYFTSSD